MRDAGYCIRRTPQNDDTTHPYCFITFYSTSRSKNGATANFSPCFRTKTGVTADFDSHEAAAAVPAFTDDELVACRTATWCEAHSLLTRQGRQIDKTFSRVSMKRPDVSTNQH